MNHSKSKYLNYEVVFEPDRKHQYEYDWRTNYTKPWITYPTSSFSSAVRYITSPERYASTRAALCELISNPSLYRWRWYQCYSYNGTVKNPTPKQIKEFKKECQRLINSLDQNFKKQFIQKEN